MLCCGSHAYTIAYTRNTRNMRNLRRNSHDELYDSKPLVFIQIQTLNRFLGQLIAFSSSDTLLPQKLELRDHLKRHVRTLQRFANLVNQLGRRIAEELRCLMDMDQAIGF